MSTDASGTGTTTPDAGSAAVPAGAVAESQRVAAETASDDAPASEILAKLGFGDEDEGDVLEGSKETAKPDAEAKGDEDADAKKPEEVDEDAANLAAINKRSAERRRAKAMRQRSNGTPAPQTAAVASAKAATEAAEAAAKAKPAEVAKPVEPAQPSSEVAQAMRDVLAQIEKLAGDDEAAEAAKAEGVSDKTKDERVAALTEIRTQVAKIAEGLKETDALKAQVEKLSGDLKAQADEANVKRIIADSIDAIATEIPKLASAEKHDVQVKQNGTTKTLRLTGHEILHWQAARFYDKYGVAPDLRELARRVEKKLQGESPEKNGEKQPATRKTVSTSHSSPPAARQGPDKRTSKDAEADFFARLGVEER